MGLFKGVAAALGLSLSLVASAQTSLGVYVFVTVDEVTATAGRLYITGIKQGESSPSRQYVTFSSECGVNSCPVASALDSCNRMALLAMTRPGQFLYTIDSYNYPYSCKLTRVNP